MVFSLPTVALIFHRLTGSVKLLSIMQFFLVILLADAYSLCMDSDLLD